MHSFSYMVVQAPKSSSGRRPSVWSIIPSVLRRYPTNQPRQPKAVDIVIFRQRLAVPTSISIKDANWAKQCLYAWWVWFCLSVSQLPIWHTPSANTMYDYNFRKCHTIILSLPTHCNGTRAKEQTFSSSEQSLGLDNLKKIIAILTINQAAS